MGKKLLGCGWLEKIIWPKGPYSQSYGFSCESENEVAQSCPTLSDPMDCSPPGSSVCGIFQARVLGWGAIAFSNGFSCSHVQMWDLDHKEGWMLKNWCFQKVVLKKTEIPLDSKEIKPVNPKRNQPWIFIGRTDAEAEAPILWPPDAKNWFIGKDPDAGKNWRQEEKVTTEDEMVGSHHQLSGHEFEQTLGNSEGQGILVCCSLWDHKDSYKTE